MDVDLGRATSGLDLLYELKAQRDAPVILLWGLASVDVRVSGLELGRTTTSSSPPATPN